MGTPPILRWLQIIRFFSESWKTQKRKLLIIDFLVIYKGSSCVKQCQKSIGSGVKMLQVVTRSKHSAQNGFTPTALILRRPNTWRKHDFTPTALILRRPNTQRKQYFTSTALILRRPITRRKYDFTLTAPENRIKIYTSRLILGTSLCQ